MCFLSFKACSPRARELLLEGTHQPTVGTLWGWLCHPKWHCQVRKTPNKGVPWRTSPQWSCFLINSNTHPGRAHHHWSPGPGWDDWWMQLGIHVGQGWLCFRNDFQKGCNITAHFYRPSDPAKRPSHPSALPQRPSRAEQSFKSA